MDVIAAVAVETGFGLRAPVREARHLPSAWVLVAFCFPLFMLVPLLSQWLHERLQVLAVANQVSVTP